MDQVTPAGETVAEVLCLPSDCLQRLALNPARPSRPRSHHGDIAEAPYGAFATPLGI